MANERIKVDGLPRLAAAFKQLDADMQEKIARAGTNAAAQVVKKRAVRNIETSPSIVTGSLRDSVIVKRLLPREVPPGTSAHIVTVRGRGKPTNKKGEKVNRAPHAHFIEYGTVHSAPEPFLRPALYQGAAEAIGALKERVQKRLDQSARSVAAKAKQ